MTTKEMIEVLQAHERGDLIEYAAKCSPCLGWCVCAGPPLWDFHVHNYRIKPVPPKPREWWVAVTTTEFESNNAYYDISAAQRDFRGCAGVQYVHVREVLPEN